VGPGLVSRLRMRRRAAVVRRRKRTQACNEARRNTCAPLEGNWLRVLAVLAAAAAPERFGIGTLEAMRSAHSTAAADQVAVSRP
jgi:hypothetical protein